MSNNIAPIAGQEPISAKASTAIQIRAIPEKDKFDRGETITLSILIDGEKINTFAEIPIALIEHSENETSFFKQISLIPGRASFVDYIVPGTIGMGAISKDAITLEAIGPKGIGSIAQIAISIIN